MSEARIGALKTRAEEVRDEQVDSANSATRVGQLLWDMIDYMGDIDGSSSSEDVDVELGSSLSAIKSLTYPPNNNSLLIYNSGSTTGWTYIDKSELGGGGGGGQGQGIDLDAMWQSLSGDDNTKVIHPSHLNLSNYVTKTGTTWWGASLVGNAVSGNMNQVGTIQFTNGITLEPITDNGQFYLKLSHNGGGTNVAHFYATGGVSALGMGSSGSGGGGGGDDTSGDPLNYILGDVNSSSSSVPTYYNGNMYALLKNGNTGAWSISPLTLNSLGDVVITNPSDGQVLTYDISDHKWKNAAGGTGGATTLEGLNNVSNATQPQNVNSILYRPSGSTSNPFNNWKDVKFQIYGEILHSYTPTAASNDGGILTQIDLDTKSYRLPVYTAGVSSNSSDTSNRYYLTGSLMVEGETTASHSDDRDSNGKWKHNFDKTYCSPKVYMKNGKLYSGYAGSGTEGDYEVLTKNNFNLTAYWPTGRSFVINEYNGMTASRLANNPQSWTDMYVSWGSGNKDYYATDGSKDINIWLKEYLPNTITGGTTAVKEYNSSTQQYIGVTRNIWGQTYINNGVFQNVQGDLIVEKDTTTNNESIKLSPNTLNVENPKIYMLGRNILEYERSKNNVSVDTLAIGFGAEGNNLTHTNIIGKNIELTSTVGNVYIPNASTLAKGLRIGDAVLYWDSQNNSLAVKKYDDSACNFYAFGGVSALGMSSGIGTVPTMTFGNLTVNNTLNVGEIYLNDTIYAENNDIDSVGALDAQSINTSSITIGEGVSVTKIALISSNNKLRFVIGNQNYDVSYTNS